MPVIGTKADDGTRYVLMIRCEEHADVPQLNANCDDMSECGACQGQETFELLTEVIEPMLDAYADRLTHHCVLRAKLASARDRLNLLSPGAGNYLDGDIGDDGDNS